MRAFEILEASRPSDRAAWLGLLDRWPDREPFAHPGYIEAFLGAGEEAVCAVSETGAGAVLMPMVVRPAGPSLSDAVTPYGYGGPFAIGQPEAEKFWEGLGTWADERGVVSLFARLSLFQDSLITFKGETATLFDNVVRDLSPEPEQIWMDYEHKVRKNVKKALRSGVTVERDEKGRRLSEFHTIYLETMKRRDAAEGYRFELSFFERLLQSLEGQWMLFHALFEGRVVSSELVLGGPSRTYSFLGGTTESAFELRPNDLLKHEIIVWSRETGRRWFVLGGGYRPDDGIFRYKLAFAPKDGVRPFRAGRLIFNRPAYESLLDMRRREEPGWEPAPGFFPAYRAPAA